MGRAVGAACWPSMRHVDVYYQACPGGYMAIYPHGSEIPPMLIPGDYEQEGYVSFFSVEASSSGSMPRAE